MITSYERIEELAMNWMLEVVVVPVTDIERAEVGDSAFRVRELLRA